MPSTVEALEARLARAESMIKVLLTRVGAAGTFTLPALTSGSVLFSNGSTIAQNNTKFFWDNTNNRLGLGVASPTQVLDIAGNVLITGTGFPALNLAGANNTITLRGNNAFMQAFSRVETLDCEIGTLTDNSAIVFSSGLVTTQKMVIRSTGLIGIGTTAPKSKMHIEGASGWIIADEQDTDVTTTELDANDSVAIYTKNNKLVFAYNNAGTITYLTCPLDAATTTWTQSTTAP